MQIDKTHHSLYLALHAARSAAPDLWSDQQCTHVLTTIMGRRSWSWRVVGVTPAALDALAAMSFYNRKDLGLVRAHLVNRIEFVRHLMHLPQPATYEYFVNYWTANDRTVLALRSENGKEGIVVFLPFDAPGLFSSERLAGWVHGKAERAFLQSVHTRRPAPVSLTAKPTERSPVFTRQVENRNKLLEVVRRVCDARRQVYWVCPLVEESEALQVKTAEETHARLKSDLPDIRVGLLHSQLKAGEKATITGAFAHSEIQVLIETPAIAVSASLRNGSLMVIDHAQRMGLAQLHQLRDRLEEGTGGCFCLLLLPPSLDESARKRLSIFYESAA